VLATLQYIRVDADVLGELRKIELAADDADRADEAVGVGEDLVGCGRDVVAAARRHVPNARDQGLGLGEVARRLPHSVTRQRRPARRVDSHDHGLDVVVVFESLHRAHERARDRVTRRAGLPVGDGAGHKHQGHTLAAGPGLIGLAAQQVQELA
jgi:hypothetical protein